MTFWRQFVDLSFQFELYQKMFNVILDSNSLRVRHFNYSHMCENCITVQQ